MYNNQMHSLIINSKLLLRKLCALTRKLDATPFLMMSEDELSDESYPLVRNDSDGYMLL